MQNKEEESGENNSRHGAFFQSQNQKNGYNKAENFQYACDFKNDYLGRNLSTDTSEVCYRCGTRKNAIKRNANDKRGQTPMANARSKIPVSDSSISMRRIGFDLAVMV